MDGVLNERGLKVLIVDALEEAPGRLLGMARALGWSPQLAQSGQHLFSAFGEAQAGAWPHVLILELRLPDTNAHQMIARLESECEHGALPPLIIVADFAQSQMNPEQLMRKGDVLLVRPVTSSALFNAVNAAVVGRPDALERVLQSTSFDELRTQWLSGVRILVVDDSEINLEVAKRILEKQGAIVATRNDGLAALAYVRDNRQFIDVVLMDVQMPVLDGNEATRRIRGELKLAKLPIAALTAGALVGERQRAFEAGMNDFIIKPFDPQVLIRIVRRLAEEARGEPIPMVLLDALQSRSSTGSRPMSCIDPSIVQQMFGEDKVLFRSVLFRLLSEFAEFALPISVSSDDPIRRDLLQARAHKLKGSAGMIGATRVMRLAGAVEKALHETRPTDAVEGILRQLALAFITLREEAEPLLQTPAESNQPAAGEPTPSVAAADIEELRALLEAQNLAAVEKFALLSASLGDHLGPVRFARLQDAIEGLDFKLGAELLRPGNVGEIGAAISQ